MPDITVSVSPSILRWVSERSRMSYEKLERKFPDFRQWLKGTSRQLNLKQVEKLAKNTNTPIGFFFLPDPPMEDYPVPYFRTVNDSEVRTPSANLLDTVYTMQQRQEWMREFLIEEGAKKLPFVATAQPTQDIREVAKNIRSQLGLTKQWASEHKRWTDALAELYERIERLEILVVANGIVGNNPHRKLDVEEFRGFVLYDELAPLIFVNNADSKAAQMFTLAHEVAHLWYGSSAMFDLREMQPASNSIEIVCNAVAAEVLVPEDELKEVWPEIRGHQEPFQSAARQFKVSSLVAARRALDMKLIGMKDFLSFYEEYQKDDRRKRAKQEGGSFWLNQRFRIGNRFGNAVVVSTKNGRISYTDAYRLTGLSGKTFEKYVKRIVP